MGNKRTFISRAPSYKQRLTPKPRRYRPRRLAPPSPKMEAVLTAIRLSLGFLTSLFVATRLHQAGHTSMLVGYAATLTLFAAVSVYEAHGRISKTITFLGYGAALIVIIFLP